MRRYLAFVRFEHTVFALPLVLAGALAGAGGLPDWRVLLLIVAAAAGARTLAMALNRIIDAPLDARNPRTQARELPSGRMTRGEGWGVAAAGGVVYLASAAALSPLCLALSPLPVAAFAGYPYLKRVTSLAHLGIGAADALGPMGAWVAVRSAARLPVLQDAAPLWLLAAFTALWIAGFDVIYATLDEAHDREAGLRSLPAALGTPDALRVSGALHAAAGACLFLLYAAAFDGPLPLILLAGIVLLLVEEHRRAADVAFAFFTANAGVSGLVLAFVAAGVLLPRPA